LLDEHNFVGALGVCRRDVERGRFSPFEDFRDEAGVAR
jgi:hypothetical protein